MAVHDDGGGGSRSNISAAERIDFRRIDCALTNLEELGHVGNHRGHSDRLVAIGRVYPPRRRSADPPSADRGNNCFGPALRPWTQHDHLIAPVTQPRSCAKPVDAKTVMARTARP